MRNYTPKKIPDRSYIIRIIKNYPNLKYTYTEAANSILLASPNPPDKGSHRKSNNTSDTTGDRVIKLSEPHMQRDLEKIQAFEVVYDKLGGDGKKFIREHFWKGKCFRDCDVYYCERTLSDIRGKFIQDVAIQLGEIE